MRLDRTRFAHPTARELALFLDRHKIDWEYEPQPLSARGRRDGPSLEAVA
jgi:hypothetical protein